MRKIFAVAMFLAFSSIAGAQAVQVQPEGWARVRALSVGTSIRVSMKKEKVRCRFQAVSDDGISCVSSGKVQSYSRSEIRSVRIPHRVRSTLAGLAIGAAGGALIGAPFGQSGSLIGHGAAAAIIAVPGALIGAIVGACTDFTHSTVYKAN